MKNMPKLNQMELNSIREVVTAHQMTANKLNDYAGLCQDPQVKQMFTTAASEAKKSAQTLIQML